MENSPASAEPVGDEDAIVPAPDPSRFEPTVRGILRVVVTVVLSAFALYLVYLLRTPISWLIFATFVSVVVSAPVKLLTRRMPRALAIAVVYVFLVAIPLTIGAILVPAGVQAISDLVGDFPSYVDDVKETVNESDTLSSLNEDFDLIGKLQDFADDAADHAGDVAGILADVGAGLVGSVFAGVTILVMSIFMVSRGRIWTDAVLRTRPAEEAAAIRRALDRMAVAVAGYVGGALLQATIAGIAAFIVLTILDAPAPLALAAIVLVFDLIPLVGATIGAILVGIVTLFNDFPTATIVWVVFAIVYQLFENYVIQPRIQEKAVQLDPFIIVIAALFGGTLMGIVGALLAIPTAAAAQIAVREYLEFRRTYHAKDEAAVESGADPPDSLSSGEPLPQEG